ncbi:TRAP transporter small permease [Acuticoccus kandeliae]|uniref:TRAP transporter small permease n=1 Tax=Acuticoccus kandeliae TaxID=2073160 RepID=UPI000D3E85FA|nr:TRAP transporter small permease [Acuticoccus kandeliae]
MAGRVNDLGGVMDRFYVVLVETLIIGGLVVMVALTFASTFLRSLGYGGIYWSEELTRYTSIWVVMLASGLGTRYGIHLGVDLVVGALPPRLAKAFEYAAHAIVLFFAGVLVIYGTRLSLANIGQLSTSLSMPMAYAQAAIPVGGALVIYETLRAIAFDLLGRRDPAPDPDGLAASDLQRGFE